MSLKGRQFASHTAAHEAAICSETDPLEISYIDRVRPVAAMAQLVEAQSTLYGDEAAFL